jgi:tetratricopeptide (TPR) repeat protein
VPENPRIEELRRRVQKDPASIAFAQLAEEYRRAGSYQEAISACRAGLAIHPGYNSARVTLGRALIGVNDLDSAEAELNQVLRNAPENLAAIRGLADVHHRRGELGDALMFYQAALGLAKHDPDLEQTVDDLSRALTLPVTLAAQTSDAEPEPEPPALPELERLLEAIHSYRQRREV